MEIYAASKKLAPSELDIPEKSDKANKPQSAEEVLVKTIHLRTGYSSKTTIIGWPRPEIGRCAHQLPLS
jgi:hypothetical protein